MANINTVNQRLAPLIQRIQSHPLYAEIHSIAHLRIFMEHHVFAVYDFMCLLKELHRRIVSTQAPWFPPKDAYSARLINQILVDEEGDLSENGINYVSHFELYLSAMRKIDADTQRITVFLQRLHGGETVDAALKALHLPEVVQHFVKTTFSFFQLETHQIAAAFVYGREAITPLLFTPLLNRLERSLTGEEKVSVQTVYYYFQRHIELDGDDHFPRALQMLKNIAGDEPEKWQTIQASAELALHARLNFLTGIQAAIQDSMVISCL